MSQCPRCPQASWGGRSSLSWQSGLPGPPVPPAMPPLPLSSWCLGELCVLRPPGSLLILSGTCSQHFPPVKEPSGPPLPKPGSRSRRARLMQPLLSASLPRALPSPPRAHGLGASCFGDSSGLMLPWACGSETPAAKGPRVAPRGPEAGGLRGLAGTRRRRRQGDRWFTGRDKPGGPSRARLGDKVQKGPPAQRLLCAWIPWDGWE